VRGGRGAGARLIGSPVRVGREPSPATGTPPGAREHLRALAGEPRPAGSAAEHRARAYCASVLAAAGYEVREEPFEYSAFPGRWATPTAGLIAALGLAAAGPLGRVGSPGLALSALLACGATVAAGGWWMAARGVLGFPALRSRAVNLVAARGAPRVWLVAHLDSKSQPVPMALRVAGIVATAGLWIAAVALAVADLRGLEVGAAWPWVSASGMLAALPVIATTVGARSPGALDNASGTAAVLVAAESLADDAVVDVGVLLTSAEELGLAGARAWVRGRRPAVALNCDGVDDVGTLTCMYSGPAPTALLHVVRRAAGDEPVAVRRLLPGILVDGVALADAGWPTITVSRGTLGTLARIHTPRDTLDRLQGTGIEAAAALLVRVARTLA
jgi:hypothetical protein